LRTFSNLSISALMIVTSSGDGIALFLLST
jgi:hypothetical protein